MKKWVLFLLIITFASHQKSLAYFYAKSITDSRHSWNTVQMLDFESKIEVYGLFYQTTVTFNMKLGKGYRWDLTPYNCQNPYPDKYEFQWTFSLPKNTFIKELSIWDKNKKSYVDASIIDLSTAEANYNPNSTATTNVLLRQYMRRDYSGSYSLQYDMRVSPINWDESVSMIIKYISPCEMSYEKRIITDYSSQFNVGYYFSECYTSPFVNLLVQDYNNRGIQPQNFSGFSRQWVSNDGYWWQMDSVSTYSDYKIYLPAESDNGKFLKTCEENKNLFYQLAVKPQISDELRYGRKIVVAFDLVQTNMSSYSRGNFLEMLKEALFISTTEKDSLIFVTTDFDVKWLANDFAKMSEELINEGIDSVKQIIPQLNSLPYMLKDIVRFLNEKNTNAEVWLVSDDYRTAVRSETTMELLNQTFFIAKNRLKFNIIDISSWGGNQSLYDNLTRLSGGNYVAMYNKYYLYMIDDALDCWAPKVSTVEIDPMPSSGFTHSRTNLNGTRNNFNITSRYFQIGRIDGQLPLSVFYYGNYLANSYFKKIDLTPDESITPQDLIHNPGLYWYGNYILNDLFLQPQSYSTIKYIEELAVQENLITPYSGYIIPGPTGYIGFKRAYVDEYVQPKENQVTNDGQIKPTELSLTSYPNPFNPRTTIILKLNSELLQADKKLDIYNILGQRIKEYDLSQYKNQNEITIEWDGLNNSREQVASGMYFAVFRSSSVVKTLKLLLVR